MGTLDELEIQQAPWPAHLSHTHTHTHACRQIHTHVQSNPGRHTCIANKHTHTRADRRTDTQTHRYTHTLSLTDTHTHPTQTPLCTLTHRQRPPAWGNVGVVVQMSAVFTVLGPRAGGRPRQMRASSSAPRRPSWRERGSRSHWPWWVTIKAATVPVTEGGLTRGKNLGSAIFCHRPGIPGLTLPIGGN